MGQRVYIIVDGNNFYHRLKEQGYKNILSLNYSSFTSFLENGRETVFKGYYIGTIREESGNMKSKQMMTDQFTLFQKLWSDEWSTRLGHLLKTQRYQEKGVDVMMVIDMLVGAYEDKYDQLILVSSDTDLIPAIQKVRSMGKIVEYVGFRYKPSYGMMKHADAKTMLTSEDINEFFI